MSAQGVKRRQSSSPASDHQLTPHKRQKSSPTRPARPLNGRHRGLTHQQPNIVRRIFNVFNMGSLLDGQETAPPSPSPSQTASSSTDDIFKPHSKGSLAMLQAFDSVPALPSDPLSSSINRIADGPGASDTSPIDLADDDDDDEEETEEIDHTSRPDRSLVIPSSSQAGPSRPKPRQSPSTPLLFHENFSNQKSHLPTPPESQETPLNSPPVSPYAVRRNLSRPDVTHYDKPRRRFGWEKSPGSPTSSVTSSRSTSSRTSRGGTSRKRKSSNIRHRQRQVEDIERKKVMAKLGELEKTEEGSPAGKASRRVRMMLMGRDGGRHVRNPSEFALKQLVQTGMGSKFALQAMLTANSGNGRTLDEQLTSSVTPNKQDPTLWRKTGQSAKAKAKEIQVKSIKDALEAIEKEEEEEERRVQERLKPKVPTKLKPEQEAAVEKHLANPSFKARCSTQDEVIASSLRRLAPTTWLNDDIVNAYCALMIDRAKKGGQKKVHYFNSFFYSKLSGQGYEGGKLKRWTKKMDLFDLDVLIFPVNIGNMHWTAAAVNFERKRVEYYDSMGDYGGQRKSIFRNVRAYLDAEHKEKKGSKFDATGWEDAFNPNTPQQDNGSDCGIFTCQTLEMIARGRDVVADGFEFSAENMPFFRRLMIFEIGQVGLEKRTWGRPAV